MKKIITALCLSLSLAACTEKSSAPAAAPEKVAAAAPVKEAAPAAPSGTQVAEFPISVDAPGNAVANDPGGSPGFHAEDGSIYVIIGKHEATAPATLDDAKKATEEFGFKKWVKADKTADGWSMQWIGLGMDMDGKEYDTFNYEVVKKVGDATWNCRGSVKKAEQVEANLKLCQSLKAFSE